MNPLELLLAAIGGNLGTLSQLQPIGYGLLGIYESLAKANAAAGLNLRFYKAASFAYPQLGQSALVSAYRYVGYLQDPGALLSQFPSGTPLPALMARDLPFPDRGLPEGITQRYNVQITVQFPGEATPKTWNKWVYAEAGDSIQDVLSKGEQALFGPWENEYSPYGDSDAGAETTWTSEVVDFVSFL